MLPGTRGVDDARGLVQVTDERAVRTCQERAAFDGAPRRGGPGHAAETPQQRVVESG
ncbi:hypothetical protein [Streptomyces sp. NPDC051776]|uniref:hypothetical protein n=1 Tax=Streptomyces sp. NPDC051776 TaxID=3155414 RepID=UPI00344167FE